MSKEKIAVYEITNGLFDVTHMAPIWAKGNIHEIASSTFMMMKKPINQITIQIEKYLIKKYLGNSGLALDVGVGFGLTGGELAKAGYSVHGIDADPFGIVASTLYIKYLLYRPFVIFFGDINVASIPTGIYDVITCTETLEHLTNDKDVIKKIYDGVISGGHAMFAVPIGD